MTGYTESYDFPATNRIGQDCCGYSDTFVVKLDATGGLAYATRIGGGGQDYANAIAVDAQGRARIVGNTMSADFPVVNPLRPQLGGDVAFHSTDGGQTWSPSSVGLRASRILALEFDPSQAGTVYASTAREGLFRTLDGGATWAQTNLPLQPVGTMTTQNGAMFLAAATGVYRTTDHGDNWTRMSWSLFSVNSIVATSGASPQLRGPGLG